MASNDWKKMTVHDASGMNRHNGKYERENGEHENKDINPELSYLNLYIGCDDYSEAYYNMRTRVKEIDKAHPPRRKNKSDTRIICAMIEIPCPQEIYSQGYEKAQQFFYDVYEIYKKFFGADNVHGGFVHFDEIHDYTDKHGSKRTSLPHMHTLVSAYAEWTDRDKKTGTLIPRKGINGKHFVTKERMKKLNTLVDDYCLANFDVHFLTGETPQRKSVEQLKAEEEVHQLTGKKKQIQTELDELHSQEESAKQNLADLTNKTSEAQQLLDERTAQLNETKKQTATTQTELGDLKKKIDELQQQVLSITLPEPPTRPPKPIRPRPIESKDRYISTRIDDSLRGFKRMSEEKKLAKKYDSLIEEWNQFDADMKKYDLNYADWSKDTQTVSALQANLKQVIAYKQDLERGQRLFNNAENLRQAKQIRELQAQKEELQSQLDSLRSNFQNLLEKEYQRRRKRDMESLTERLAYYEKYCGITPDKIKSVVIEQEQQKQEQDSLSHQEYN